MAPAESSNPVQQLCSQCGLCCNGVLFSDVKLRRSETASHFKKLGFRLFRKGASKAFSQPCLQFDGSLCRCYEQRPEQCRRFECGLLKKVTSRQLLPKAAVRQIKRARQKVRRVEELLQGFGNEERALPLVKRFSNVMMTPVELFGSGHSARRRGALLKAMDRLMKHLQEHFLS